MSKAIRVHETGGPEVLRWEDVEVGAPGPGQVRVRNTFVGLNFIDIYHRTGLYKQPLPFTPGMEGAGVVDAVGDGVTDLRAGDRVGYAGGPPGSYAELRLLQADRVVPLPASIDDATAASIMLKGMTAQYLLKQTIQVKPGDTIVFHAAAGATGLLACRWAKALGARVIATAGSDEKAEVARRNGCDHVIVYTRDSFVERVKELTGGKGARVVYDSVGKDTFMGSLDCLETRGLLVLFGQSSGPVPPFDPNLLAAKGCLYLTRPSLFAYTATKEALRATAGDLFDALGRGILQPAPPRVVPLREAAAAQRDLQERRTIGATVFAVNE
jgi:NADPH2:quinone reductase